MISKLKLKKLKKGFSNTGGRNNQGKITHYQHGSRHKQLYRLIDFKNKKEGIIRSIEYDPNRSSLISLLELKNKEYIYTLTPQNIKIGDKININNASMSKNIGSTLLLKNIPIGTFVHNIELKPNQGGKFIRSAGTFGQIIQIQKNYVKIRLSSNEERLFFKECYATIGKVSINLDKIKKLTKAGQNRWRGIRPTVRGTAMNPIDHPHGGGQGKTSGGRCSVTPWGRLTKGKKTVLKTNKYIVVKRYKKK
jgi:large subunit ribosomal protein L2